MDIPKKIDISKLEIDGLVDHMKDCISYFCLDDCYLHCCNNRYIETKDPQEVKAVFGLDKSEDIMDLNDSRLKIKEYLCSDDIKYVIEFTPCPQLDGRLCKIHENPKRPAVCRQYPIFKNDVRKVIEFSAHCPAFLEGRFEQYYGEIEKRGYKILPYKPSH